VHNVAHHQARYGLPPQEARDNVFNGKQLSKTNIKNTSTRYPFGQINPDNP